MTKQTKRGTKPPKKAKPDKENRRQLTAAEKREIDANENSLPNLVSRFFMEGER